MKDIYQFILTFYSAYKKQSSWQLKLLYRDTFWYELSINDSECDNVDKSCMFDELLDEFVTHINTLIQNIWWIVYCELFGWFLVSADWEEWLYRINSERLDKKLNEATEYFYDLFSS